MDEENDQNLSQNKRLQSPDCNMKPAKREARLLPNSLRSPSEAEN
jgi:hypothetical protein